MARHAAQPVTFDAVVSDYVTGRAKELVRQFDLWNGQQFGSTAANWAEWVGQAAEILRELTRDE